MIQANPTIFYFYLKMMDCYSEYLSQKYSVASIDNPDHYKAIILQKIVRMFHTLETLAKDSHDEVSARCVLRGVLDSVTTYCLIYQRENKDEILFRHYLYALDGFKSFKKNVVDSCLDRKTAESTCDDIINQIEEQLKNHSYSKKGNIVIRKIIENANWKYISLTNANKWNYLEMYKQVGFDNKTANYIHGYLSQFAHGLCLSNTDILDPNRLQRVLYESILVADRMIQAIFKTFPKDDLHLYFIRSGAYSSITNHPDFCYDNLLDFAKSLFSKNKTLQI